jgi:hypothetical protein
MEAIRFDWAAQDVLRRIAKLRAIGDEWSDKQEEEFNGLVNHLPSSCKPVIQLFVDAGLLTVRCGTGDYEVKEMNEHPRGFILVADEDAEQYRSMRRV